jgi:hypothetical protein
MADQLLAINLTWLVNADQNYLFQAETAQLFLTATCVAIAVAEALLASA